MINTRESIYRNNWLSSIIIAAVCGVIILLPQELQNYLVLSESGITNNQWWRLITGHFVHTNVWHFVLNIAGLGLTWLLFIEYLHYKRVAWALLLNTLGLSIFLWFFGELQDIVWYAGLSGTLHGLFAFALVLELPQKRKSTYALIAFGIGKLAYEQLGGSTDSTAELINASVAINAHLFGAILGTLHGFALLWRQRK